MVKLKKEEILNLNDYHIGETVILSDNYTFRHTHDFCEIFLIKEGEVYHHINDKQVLLRQNTLWLVMPEDEHNFRKGKCKKAQLVNIAFSREALELAKSIYKMYSDNSSDVIGTTAQLPVGLNLSILTKISLLARDKTNLFPISRKETLISILLDCFLVLQNQASGVMLVPNWLEKACREIRRRENYMEGLPRFVELANRSQEYLTRCMKKYYNTTPTEYLNGIKLEQAIILLETTDLNILSIIYESGFNNVSYFYQLFKEKYGVTPSRYRIINRTVVNPIQ